jgi:hypothetical protein
MSIVTVTGSGSGSLNTVPVNPAPQSAPVKYGLSPSLNLMPVQKLLALPLAEAAATPVSFGVQIGPAFNFGVGEPQLCITAGPGAAVHVNAKKDSDLFSDNLYKSQITVKDGEGYLSLALTGAVNGKDTRTNGDITLGFEAGASVTFEHFRKFQVNATSPTVGQALGEVISNFIMPVEPADLAALDAGDIATCSGKRNLKVSGEFTATVSAVPLATPNLPLVNQPVQLNAGPKLDVKGSYEISSAWQIRSRAVSKGVIELGFYKQEGSEFEIAVTASAGIGVVLGTTDLLTELINKLSKDPAADQKQLTAAGLKPDDIKAIKEAISGSINHSIHASLTLDLKGLASDEAAFLYTVELDKLNADTTAALSAALHGDLTLIDSLGPGITLVRSILTRTKEGGTAFKMNFIGLFNFLSLADFISKSQVIYEPASGDVVFCETASGQRIGVITLPQEQEKLRKLIFDSILMTTTYRSAGALETMGMECSAVHFAMNATTDEHAMSNYLDWFVALGLLDAAGKDSIMQTFHGTGKSTCTIRVAFNDAACDALFLHDAEARKPDDYVDLGREALKSLPLTDNFRYAFLDSDKIWNQVEGWTDIARVMQQEQGWQLNDPRIQWLITDYKTIEWWASAMSSTADKIVEMRNFLKTADPATLKTNQDFIAKKADVQKHVMGAVKSSAISFDQPFGLVALDRAAGPAALASGVLLSPAINRQFTPAKTLAA